MTDNQIELIHIKNGFRFIIRGRVDESLSFSSLYNLGGQYYELDLAEVEGANSMGLKSWLLWLKSLDAAVALRFLNCPRVIVEQLNTLKGLLPLGAIVDSFEVPFRCEVCQQEHVHLAKRGVDFLEEQGDRPLDVENLLKKDCPKCHSPMDLDTIPQKYFLFLKK